MRTCPGGYCKGGAARGPRRPLFCAGPIVSPGARARPQRYGPSGLRPL